MMSSHLSLSRRPTLRALALRTSSLSHVINPNSVGQQTLFDELQEYKDEHGNTNVPQPQSHEQNNLKLGVWVSNSNQNLNST
jgi:hypothetical protein